MYFIERREKVKKREEVIIHEGQIINGFEVIKEVERKGHARRVLCRCLGCGAELIRYVGNLRKMSVGMCKACSIKKRCTTHGLSRHRLYYVLKDMIARCYDKTHHKYHNYGARGIDICDEWLDHETGITNFYNWSIKHGYKEGLQLDRFDNELGYSPDNCRWVTVAKNNFNRRNTKGYRFHQNRWEAYITVNKKMLHLGSFKTEEEAIEVRKAAELKYYGENSPAYREVS